MSLVQRAPAHIRAIAPYQPGKPISELAREMGLAESQIIKLASNENPLGMGARARQAAQAALTDVARYPDGNGFALKSALSRRFRVGLEGIVLGNGSNDVLEMAARAFLAPDTEAVYSQHAFAVYPLATQAAGARGIEVPARAFAHDLDAMAAAVTASTRVVFIANPNNPTGTLLAADALQAFIAKLPVDVLVVLDEAYNEYLPSQAQYDAVAWLRHYPNLLISRTFSKAYGLAGLRVGYGLAQPEVADLLNRVRQPFNVSGVALAAAEAALDDDDFVALSFEFNRRGLTQLMAGFERLGLDYISSFANFICVRVGDAAAVNRSLLRQGVIVRPVANYGLPEHLRVSVGLESENQRFLAALDQALAGH